MKRVIFLVLAFFATTAFADGWRGHGIRHEHYHSGGNNWVAPLIIGGVIGYEISRNSPPPVVYAPPPVVYSPQPYQLPPAPLGYHYEHLVDASCNCWRYVIVPN